MTKTEIVRWYLSQDLPAADLLLTFSCSRDDGIGVHCGQCPSCLRRWISLANNDVAAPFEHPPWQWERVTSYYITAMQDGTYPRHRAKEFFTALQRVAPEPRLEGHEMTHQGTRSTHRSGNMKAYIAAPMFNDAEKAFNLQLAASLAGIGIGSYLPQRDGGEAAPLIRQGMDEHAVRQRIFQHDVNAIRECDLLVMVLDGRVPDEGACVELGMAHALGKPCFGLQTDCRRFGGTDSN